MQPSHSDLRHNLIVNMLDGGFYGLAIGLASFTTILPLFVSTMTDSAILVGLVPSVHNMGYLLPQLFTSKKVARQTKLKPYVLKNSIHERLPFLGLAIVAVLASKMGATAALVLTFAILIWQGLGAGLAANAWQNMIGKVIPPTYLATFFGIQAAISNLLASGGAILAGYLLEKNPGTSGFAVPFLFTSVFMAVSWYSLSRTREEPSSRVVDPDQEISLWKTIAIIFRQDKPFIWFLAARGLYYLGMMAFAFYMVYAVQELRLSEVEAGVLTSVLLITQVAANIVLGRIADRWSRKGVIEIGAITGVASCLLAWWAPSVGWFYPVIILEGIANTAFWTIGFTILLEFGGEEQRPVFVGLGNTFIVPVAVLSPLLGGWLADSASYPITFLVSAILGIVAVFVLHFRVKDPRPA